MPITFKALLLFLVVSIAGNVSAQKKLDNLDSLAGRFITQLRSEASEKIFVQTDKWLYTAGEDLWMKAYIVNALSHKYFSRSKTLYVQLVDENDTIVTQLLLNIARQQTEGFVRLPPALREGNYWLRVYTSVMLKHSRDSIFVLPIYVVNSRYPSQLITEPEPVVAKASPDDPPTVTFFPEGGSLIAGTNTMVGFRITDKAGMPLEMEGRISDIWDSIVTKFKSDASGLGKFNLDVIKSRKYTAHIKWKNQELSWPLPLVDQFASQLAVKEQNADNIKIVVSQGDSIYGKRLQSYVLGFSRDSLCFAGFGTDMYEMNIPKKNFPGGRANLLLFNEQQEVVSERAVFIEKDDVEIRTDKDNYNVRDKVAITIAPADSLRHPVYTALSIAVTDDSLIQALPLLPGNPGFKQEDTADVISDLVMLTQPLQFKGRSYHKTNITDPSPANKDIDDSESSITNIKGKILNRNNEPVPDRIVTLYANKPITLFDVDTTDINGQFRFHLLPYLDSVPLTLQVSNKKGMKVSDKIIVDAVSPFPKFTTPRALKKKLSTQQAKIVKDFRSKNIDSLILGNSKEWLKEVIVVSSKRRPTYNTSKRISNFSYVITGDRIQQMNPNDAGTAMLMAPGLHLRGGFLTLGGLTSFGASSRDEPLLVVDGIPIEAGASPKLLAPDPNATGATMGPTMELSGTGSPLLHELSKISPDVIDFVEVLKGPQAAYYGDRGSNGVILVNTNRRSNFSSRLESYGTLQYYPKSYYLSPLFSMPDYNNASLKNSTFKDYRPTLYWNGHVYSDTTGKARVEFFTSDASTTYTITVTGITSNGDIIFKKAKFRRN